MTHSAVTKYEGFSAFSGTPTSTRHHLCFGRGMRDLSEKFGLWIPVTDAEHNMSSKGTINQIHGNPAAEALSKMLGQAIYEKEIYRKQCVNDDSDPARERFMKEFGRSYM